MGCKLARTAILHGWDTYFAVGEWTGLVGKFQRTLDALDTLDLEDDDIVVFIDSSDVLVQQGPEVVRQAFENRDLDGDFIFSAEDHCFPMGGWPYNLGLHAGRYVCSCVQLYFQKINSV